MDFTAQTRTYTNMTLGNDRDVLRTHSWVDSHGETCHAIHVGNVVTLHIPADAADAAERLADLLLRVVSDIHNPKPDDTAAGNDAALNVIPLWEAKRSGS